MACRGARCPLLPGLKATFQCHRLPLWPLAEMLTAFGFRSGRGRLIPHSFYFIYGFDAIFLWQPSLK